MAGTETHTQPSGQCVLPCCWSPGPVVLQESAQERTDPCPNVVFHTGTQAPVYLLIVWPFLLCGIGHFSDPEGRKPFAHLTRVCLEPACVPSSEGLSLPQGVRPVDSGRLAQSQWGSGSLMQVTGSASPWAERDPRRRTGPIGSPHAVLRIGTVRCQHPASHGVPCKDAGLPKDVHRLPSCRLSSGHPSLMDQGGCSESTDCL